MMYSAISSAVDIRQRPLVQVPFSISCLTDNPFRQASLYKFGARSLGGVTTHPGRIPELGFSAITNYHYGTAPEQLLIHF